MAFNPKLFSTLGGQLKGGQAFQVFGYLGSVDGIVAIESSGYFNEAKESLRRNDIIRVLDITVNPATITELRVTNLPLNGDVQVAEIPKSATALKNNYVGIIAPVVTNDENEGYSAGSEWLDTVTDFLYKCLDATAGAAVWVRIPIGGNSASLIAVDTTGFSGFLDATTDTSQKVYDRLDTLTNPLLFKGDINLPADFPTLLAVKNGWTYEIKTDVTDNNAAKTNTGQSFVVGEEIAWNGTNWTVLGNKVLWTKDLVDVKTYDPALNVNLQNAGLKDVNVTTAIKLGDATNTALTTSNKTIVGGVNELKNITVITKECTGFDKPELFESYYDSTARTITLGGAGYKAYINGVEIPALIPGWVSTPHPATLDKIYYLYHDGTSAQWTDVFPGFDVVLIAFSVYRTNDKFGIEEGHGLQQWQSHKTDHFNIGTYRVSGGDISSYVLNSTTAANRRPDISACTINDEDKPTTNAALTSKLYAQRYLDGATGTIRYNLDAAEILPVLVNNPYYNQWTGATWQQTLMPANSLATVWIYEVPVTKDTQSQKYRHSLVQPQSITQATGPSAGALTTAYNTEVAKSTLDLNLGQSNLISAEYVCIAKIIVQYTGGNWTIRNIINVTGSRANQVGSPTGGFLTSVSVNTTNLSGAGIPSDPINTIQNIDVTASPTFTGLTLTGLTASRVPYIGVGGSLTDSPYLTFDPTAVNTLQSMLTIDQKIVGGNAGLLLKGLSPVSNYGVIGYSMENLLGDDVLASALVCRPLDQTTGDEYAEYVISTVMNGAMGERMTINGNHTRFQNRMVIGLISATDGYDLSRLNVVENGELTLNTWPFQGIGNHSISNVNNEATFCGFKARGTATTPLAVTQGDYLSTYASIGYDGTNWLIGGYITWFTDAAVSTGIMPTSMNLLLSQPGGGYQEEFTFRSNGHIGINSSTAASYITVNATDLSSGQVMELNAFSATEYCNVSFRKSRGTYGVLVETQDLDYLSEISSWGVNSSGTYYYGTSMAVRQVGAATATNAPTQIEFYTNNGTSLQYTQVLDSNGDVLNYSYTSLGYANSAPLIQMKELTGTTGANQGDIVSLAHGLDGDKIISCVAHVRYATDSGLPDEYTGDVGYEFHMYWDANNVNIRNDSSNSANILEKPIVVTIIYKK